MLHLLVEDNRHHSRSAACSSGFMHDASSTCNSCSVMWVHISCPVPIAINSRQRAYQTAPDLHGALVQFQAALTITSEIEIVRLATFSTRPVRTGAAR